MKKILKGVLVLAVMAFLAAPAYAAVFTFTIPEIAGMGKVHDVPSGIGTLTGKTTVSDGVEFVGNINDSSTDIWREIYIGYDSTGSEAWNDLSSYTGYGLHFTNTNQQYWYATVFVRTYDSGTTTYTNYGTAWAGLNPLDSTSRVLDLSGVSNLDSVDSIGFGIAWNDSTLTHTGKYQGDQYHMFVTPVPEPSSMILLGLGLLGFGGRFRKRFKA